MSERPVRAWPLLLLCLGCSSPLQKVFSVSGDAPSRSGLAPLGEGAVFGNEAGRVLRLGPGGSLLWTAELTREIRLTPTVVEDTVVVVTTGDDLVGLDAATGARRWRSEVGRPAVALTGLGTRVYLLSDEGELLAVDATSGGLLWKTALGSALGLHPTSVAHLALAAVPPDRLVVAGPAAVLAVAADGSRRWRMAVHEPGGLLVLEGLVWTVEPSGRVLALDVQTGEVQWQRPLGAPPASPPARALDRLWVGLQNQTLVGFRLKDEGPLWTVQVPGPVVAPVVEFQGRLLVPTSAREGRLLALEVGAPGNPPSARLDSPLLTAPLVRGDTAWVLPQDGRVVGFRLRSAAGSGR
ncbi:MAG: PQQ-binding-like beta-propeller repeat protein [Myxococcaceae bacterium]